MTDQQQEAKIDIDALVKEGHIFICEAMMIGGLTNQYEYHGDLIQRQHKAIKQLLNASPPSDTVPISRECAVRSKSRARTEVTATSPYRNETAYADELEIEQALSTKGE